MATGATSRFRPRFLSHQFLSHSGNETLVKPYKYGEIDLRNEVGLAEGGVLWLGIFPRSRVHRPEECHGHFLNQSDQPHARPTKCVRLNNDSLSVATRFASNRWKFPRILELRETLCEGPRRTTRMMRWPLLTTLTPRSFAQRASIDHSWLGVTTFPGVDLIDVVPLCASSTE